MKLLWVASLFVLQVAFATSFEIDKEHTNVGFSVQHLVISKVKGRFNDFSGKIDFDEKKGFRSIEGSIDVASIDTNEKERDKHLKSPDFFDVENAKQKKQNNVIRYKMTSYKGDAKKGVAEGEITIKGITKPLRMEVEIGGIAKDPWGNTRLAFSAEGKINRKDFGLTWNKALEAGGVLVGDNIELHLDVEGLAK